MPLSGNQMLSLRGIALSSDKSVGVREGCAFLLTFSDLKNILTV